MLSPADILAAKLIVQLGLASSGELRAILRVADGDEQPIDLITRLAEQSGLSAAIVKKLRRYIAQFEHIRHEAIFLKRLEEKKALPREQVSDIIAHLEVDAYRQRLSSVLTHLGLLTVAEAKSVEEHAYKRLIKEDLKILERYRGADFEGIDRPLLPVKAVDTAVFQVSNLFRGRETQALVRERVKRLRLEIKGAEPLPAIVTGSASPEFVPEASGEFEVDDVDIEEASELRQSTRYHRKAAPAEGATGLKERRSIGIYQVVECLGQGGMGAVYVATAEGSGSLVAVKVMLGEKAHAEDISRFEREAKITGMLDHENTIRLIDEGLTPDGLSYMAISLHTGKSLRELLKDRGAFPPDLAFRVFEQLLAGMESVHQKRIVHRDLKPENVLVIAGPDHEVRIMDFGIARLLDDDRPPEQRLFRTRVGVVSGSPAYIAPETISGDAIDARTDIYSLGVMLFEMLTGQHPLPANSPYDYLREHLIGIPLTLAQAKRDRPWSASLEGLIAQLLAKEKEDRPPSCAAILKRLDAERAAQAGVELDPKEEVGSKSGFLNSFFKRFKGG